MAAPLMAPPLPNLRVSLLGVVTKKTLGEFQRIHHLFYQKRASVNDAITSELCSAWYTSSIIQSCGPGAL